MKNITENTIEIEGTYGDPVTLHLNGFIDTKHNESYKIKSVNIEKHEVKVYGGGTVHFGKISNSFPYNDESKEWFLKSINEIFEISKIKIGSIIDFEITKEIGKHTYKLENIIYPTLTGEDFLPKIILEKIDTNEKIEVVITDTTDFKYGQLCKVIYTPYTFEEKLSNLLSKHCNYDSRVKDTNLYLKELKKLMEAEIKERTDSKTTII